MRGSIKWKDIEGFEGLYTISNTGLIKSYLFKVPRPLKPSLARGYKKVTLSLNGKLFYETVHRLVAQAFIQNPENKPCVNHKDGNKLNNHVNNLEWCTHQENHIHAFKIGLRVSAKGEDVNGVKLTENDVLDIRAIYPLGWFSQKEIAKGYGVDQGLISKIVNNVIWTHL